MGVIGIGDCQAAVYQIYYRCGDWMSGPSFVLRAAATLLDKNDRRLVGSYWQSQITLRRYNESGLFCGTRHWFEDQASKWV